MERENFPIDSGTDASSGYEPFEGRFVRLRMREAQINDLPRILEIYNEVVKSSPATFDLEELKLDQRKKWFLDHGGKHPLIVAEIDGTLVGYCSLSPFRDKLAYMHTVESSVYVDHAYRGRGVGKVLMKEMLRKATELGYHVMIAGITSGNKPSVLLHSSLGFRFIGCFKEVGFKFGKWQDVDFYQLFLS